MIKWRWLLYLCGENDLDTTGSLVRNLYQLEKEGPSNEVEVLFQVAGLSQANGLAGTKRYRLKKNDRLRADFKIESELVADLGELDTGEEKTLVDCLEWGFGDSTATYNMLLLWNHGSGVLDVIERLGVPVNPDVRDNTSLIAGLSRCFFKRKVLREAAALGTVNEDTLRAIGYDVTFNGDALETLELKKALENGLIAANRRRAASGLVLLDKIDLLAFDACFMASFELAVELRNIVRVMVASEASEPVYGYPYGRILAGLKADSDLTPARFAQSIADQFLKAYTAEYWFVTNPVTLSAMDLHHVDEVSDALNKFFGGIVGGCRLGGSVTELVCRGVSDDAAKDAPRFFQDGKYIDVFVYLERFMSRGMRLGLPLSPIIESNGPLWEDVKAKATCPDFRLANVSHQRKRSSSDPDRVTTGFTLLYPPSALTPELLRHYDELTFSKAPMGAWREFLRQIKSLD